MTALKSNGPFGIKLIVSAPFFVLGTWLVLFYSYCFRVREVIGHWPSSAFDRIPREIDHGFHDSVVWFLLVAIVVLFVPWLGLLAYHLCWSKRIRFDGK